MVSYSGSRDLERRAINRVASTSNQWGLGPSRVCQGLGFKVFQGLGFRVFQGLGFRVYRLSRELRFFGFRFCVPPGEK